MTGIDFCATLQIFYPFSAQIYVDRFPGKDPRDCNKSMSRTKAKESNCTNADYPDMYGHYREHDVVQIKHHWFWKISYVFEELKVAGGLRDLQVLFLEEDHFVMPDAIQVLRKLSEKYKAFRLNYEIKIGEQISFSDEIPIITG